MLYHVISSVGTMRKCTVASNANVTFSVLVTQSASQEGMRDDPKDCLYWLNVEWTFVSFNSHQDSVSAFRVSCSQHVVPVQMTALLGGHVKPLVLFSTSFHTKVVRGV